jgi:type IV pilus assembly protein PilB
MGVEPFLISAAIMGVVAQRLARKLCDQCKEPDDPPREALYRVGLTDEEIDSATFFRAVGCEECSNRGFKGRMGVFEFLTLNEELQELIVRRAPLSEITQAAIAGGMITLLKDGLSKVKSGSTTLEEVLRVVSGH